MTEKKTENGTMVGAGVDFERIRRITGYLVGTTDRWNMQSAPRSATA